MCSASNHWTDQSHTVSTARQNKQIESEAHLHLQTCIYSISPEESLPESSYLNGSTLYCIIWDNLTTSCGEVNRKKNKQTDFCSRIYTVWFGKWVTLMSICTYDFTAVSKSPHCSYQEITAQWDNAWLCVCVCMCVWIQENAKTVGACGAPEGS